MFNRSAMHCTCGAPLYEDTQGHVFCEATEMQLRYHDERHSRRCVRTDDGFWDCVKQCAVHRAQLKLV
jgi:hypothetical protein